MSTVVHDTFSHLPNLLKERLEDLLPEAEGKRLTISGVSSTVGLARFLAQKEHPAVSQRNHLVVLPTKKEIADFTRWLEFFEPETDYHILPSYDVSPYSGLFPNSRVSSARAGWLTNAQTSKSGIFICEISALVQRTLPAESINDHILELSTDEEVATDFTTSLAKMGYRAVPLVEDMGSYAIRGGIIDIFPPSLKRPVRIELFGDTIESIREFDPEGQRSLEKLESVLIGPAKEVLFDDDERAEIIHRIRQYAEREGFEESNFSEQIRSLTIGNEFLGIEYFLPFFYEETALPFDHFISDFSVWSFDQLELTRRLDQFFENLKMDFENASETDAFISPPHLFCRTELGELLGDQTQIAISPVELDEETDERLRLRIPTSKVKFAKSPVEELQGKLAKWRETNARVFFAINSEVQKTRLNHLLEDLDVSDTSTIQGTIPESVFLPDDQIVLLRAEDVLGRQRKHSEKSARDEFTEKASALSFGELKEGDLVVHNEHGVGVYSGLEVMDIGGAKSEFIQIKYKEGDKLFLPVYRVHQIQKYSGPKNDRLLDKLGGQQFEKTKIKVRSKLRDIAGDLLQLYVARSQSERPAFSAPDTGFDKFEGEFPFEETVDQRKAIDSIVHDMTSKKPMDRLVCGDVGFGKTEIAMRAAFKAVQDGRQVAVLAPTTVLTYQHFENFKKRFKNQASEIACLNRFLSKAEAREIVQKLKTGKIDVVIGTHRLLSKDVEFKDLGLLIVDEEQKFGVVHKEKIRKLKTSVDTLALSATPIPRTLNMSLMGLRDLSLISTPPVDRLPTRTFVSKFHPDSIRKSIMAEVERGGQVFFLHNRVQSIYGIADELKEICPNVRFAVAHGQMEEKELEKIVVDFYEHKIDVLVCTTIIESGLDIPKANTMFIDKANTFGLSQLYQLRGRVGRGKQRAYCYLLLPRTGNIDKEAQERLKIIQENTALGSGIKIAHYDLELRGSGNILGENQSGHINAVGYELYLELFEEALREAKGETVEKPIEPEINLRIPAFIPDNYIQDIRTRLSYYKTLSQISSIEDIDKVEDELRDLFGKLPEPTLNLLGVMLLRLVCKKLAIRDLSAGPKTISLAFTEKTSVSPQRVIELTMQENKKYSLTPDNRLKIRMNEITWPKVYEELQKI